MTTSSKITLPEGSVVCGKWNRRSYRVDRLLGEGANGSVYLVRSGNRAYALKIGFDAIDMQMEVNVLRMLAKQSDGADAFLFDADDLQMGGRSYPFYVMRYVRGVSPSQYLKRHGEAWFYVIGANLLKKLCRLHRQGWIFGDLKMANALVSGYGEVDLVDYGGVTEKGRSVKQFTEVHDRGFWNAGSRTADEGYDLFAFAVFCLQLAGQQKQIRLLAEALPQNRCAEDLLKLVDESPMCRAVAPVLRKALLGEYATAFEALQEWKRLTERHGMATGRQTTVSAAWIKAAFAGSVALFISALYALFH